MSDGFVLDASTTMTLFFDDEDPQLVVPVLNLWSRGTAVVPRIWDVEVANALALGLRRGRFDWHDVARMSSMLDQLPTRRVEPAAAGMAGLVEFANAHGLTAYDASYLAVAVARDVPLATNDREMARAATAAGVPLVA